MRVCAGPRDRSGAYCAAIECVVRETCTLARAGGGDVRVAAAARTEQPHAWLELCFVTV